MALKTVIKELSDANINPIALVAPQNILADLERLVEKYEKLKRGEPIDE